MDNNTQHHIWWHWKHSKELGRSELIQSLWTITGFQVQTQPFEVCLVKVILARHFQQGSWTVPAGLRCGTEAVLFWVSQQRPLTLILLGLLIFCSFSINKYQTSLLFLHSKTCLPICLGKIIELLIIIMPKATTAFPLRNRGFLWMEATLHVITDDNGICAMCMKIVYS